MSLLVLLGLIAAVPASAAPRSLTISTDKGSVAGASADEVDRFLGIPYAAPPVGTGRWQPPAPAAAWTGTRSATSPGSRCLQFGGDTGPGMSEDCLYLNVYTPAHRKNRPLPVLFWIHGGGFSSGSGDTQDGSLIARTDDVVVVTINYRLGVFGFLGLPGLSKQGAGNYGLLDQQAALRWTQRNIGASGGDASRVTIAGLSAGGHSVCALLASPPARGLFSGAIIQSGGCPSHTVKQAVARGKKYAAAAGCSASPVGLACLRAKPASELQAAAQNFTGGALSGSLPVSGVPELPVAPLKAVRTGRTANVPLLIGHTRDEVRSRATPFADATKEQYERAVRIEFADEADAVLAHYPLETVRYWGSFMKHGNPATPVLAAWPSYRAGTFMSLLPGGESRALKTEVYEARRQCAFWNSIDYDWLPVNPDRLAAQAGVSRS